jgi:hypothetical protein
MGLYELVFEWTFAEAEVLLNFCARIAVSYSKAWSSALNVVLLRKGPTMPESFTWVIGEQSGSRRNSRG